MSYLLTEIALEMLGFKFYDTNGVFHLTNFQQSMAAVQNDVHPDEPSLMDFIQQPSNCSSEQNLFVERCKETPHEPTSSRTLAKPLISFDLRRAPGRTLAKVMKHESDKLLNVLAQRRAKKIKNSDTSEASTAKSVASNTAGNSRAPAKALSKILDYESVTIRSQISQRLEAALRESTYEEQSNKEGYQNHYLTAEQNKIVEDAKEMKNFRLILEERLLRIDPRPYATYQRTFGVEQ